MTPVMTVAARTARPAAPQPSAHAHGGDHQCTSPRRRRVQEGITFTYARGPSRSMSQPVVARPGRSRPSPPPASRDTRRRGLCRDQHDAITTHRMATQQDCDAERSDSCSGPSCPPAGPHALDSGPGGRHHAASAGSAWSWPSRCSIPWVSSSSSSAARRGRPPPPARPRPAGRSRCRRAPGSHGLPGAGARSSSIGKLRTSVGPGTSIHPECSSTSRRESTKESAQLNVRVQAHLTDDEGRLLDSSAWQRPRPPSMWA